MEFDHAFGAEMAAARRRQGMSQRELSDRLRTRNLRLDVPAISRIEKGNRDVRLSEAMTIVSVLGMSLDELIPRTPLEHALSLDARARDAVEAGVRQAAEGLGLALVAWDALEAERVRLAPVRAGGSSPTDREGYFSWILQLLERDYPGPFLALGGQPSGEIEKAVTNFFEGAGRIVTTMQPWSSGKAHEPETEA